MQRRLFMATVGAVALATAGCADFNNRGVSTGRSNIENFTVKVIDGCEYLEYDYGSLDQRVYSFAHKGNCKNPIHKCGS